MSTGQNAHQRLANVRLTDIFIRWRPFQVLSMFKICHRIPTDKTDITGQGMYKQDQERTRSGRETDTNGLEKTEFLLSVSRPVVLSVDV